MQHSKKTQNLLLLLIPVFAVLPYISQEIKETIKYLETFNIQSLKNLTVVAPQKATTCILKKAFSLKEAYQLYKNLYSFHTEVNIDLHLNSHS